MSIEMENPTTPLELIDAAANYVEQMALAKTIGDEKQFKKAHQKAGDFLFKAARLLDSEAS